MCIWTKLQPLYLCHNAFVFAVYIYYTDGTDLIILLVQTVANSLVSLKIILALLVYRESRDMFPDDAWQLWVRTTSKIRIVSYTQKLYPHCLVLIGSRNKFKFLIYKRKIASFTIELKLISTNWTNPNQTKVLFWHHQL